MKKVPLLPYNNGEVNKMFFEGEEVPEGFTPGLMKPDYLAGMGPETPIREFGEMLQEAEIPYERNFRLGEYTYDFKTGNTLVEIDSMATHNTLWNPFTGGEGVAPDYHFSKARFAESQGYRVMNIFDWEDKAKVVRLLKGRESIYARKCSLEEVPKNECKCLLNEHHLQNTCGGQEVRLGLYYGNRLISVMTFGKPRYNKHYEYELLRFCSIMNVTGGAERLFKHFVREYRPQSILSYCNRSKFSGGVYEKIGMTKLTDGSPTAHWYNPKNGKHFTDNFLRQRGADQILGTHYGKGTSNTEIMVSLDYLPIFDCGQATFEWKSKEPKPEIPLGQMWLRF